MKKRRAEEALLEKAIAEECQQATLKKHAGLSLVERAAKINHRLKTTVILSPTALRNGFRRHGVRKKVIKKFQP